MKIGLLFSSVVHDTLGNARLFAHLVTTAERCGIESLWTPEHVAIPQHYQSRYPYGESGKHPTGEDRPILDPFLPLGYAAALTSKIKLGQAVLILLSIIRSISPSRSPPSISCPRGGQCSEPEWDG